MDIADEIKAGLRPVVDFVYPPRCPLCGAPLAAQSGLCIDCWSGLEQAEGPGDHGGTTQVFAASRYNEISRQMVLNLKHGRKLALAPLMARMMAHAAPQTIATGESGTNALLVPVPLHRLRLWERGFNQAGVLARELAKLNIGELCVDALIRSKRTPSLGGLGREERSAALDGAIQIRKSRRRAVAGRDVLLIDDVYTSGATSTACAQTLFHSGARSVRVLCFARAG